MKPQTITLIMLLTPLLLVITGVHGVHAVKVWMKAVPVEKQGYADPLLRVYIVVDPEGQPVQSGEIILAYPEVGLKVLEVLPGNLWGNTPLVVRNESSDGKVVFVAAKPREAAEKPGIGVSILFEVTGNETYTIRLVEARFADSDGDDLPVEVLNGSCTVTVTKTVGVETVTSTTTVTKSITVTRSVTLPPVTVTKTMVTTSTTTVTVPLTTTATVTKVVTVTPAGGVKTATVTVYKVSTTTLVSTVTVGGAVKPVTITTTVTRTKVVERIPAWSYAAVAFAIISLAALAYLNLRTRIPLPRK